MRQDEYHQLELERMERLEEAFARAYNGFATEDDWNVIRFECGLGKPVLHTISIGNKNHVTYR